MTLGVTGLTVLGPLGQDPACPAVPDPAGATFVYDEFAPDGGGGGSTRRGEDEYPTPTRAQEIRFGLRTVLRGLAGIYDDWDLLGDNDPPDAAFFQARRPSRGRRPSGSPPKTPPPGGPSPRTSRHEKLHAASDVGTDWIQVVEKMTAEVRRLKKKIETVTEEKQYYQQRAEEYAPAALQLHQLEKELQKVLRQLQQALKKNQELAAANETLRTICTEADSTLEKAKEALETANARAEDNAALAKQSIKLKAELRELQSQFEAVQREAGELRGALELSRHSAKLAGMQQTLRIRAEQEATQYLQELESVGTGIAQLSEAVLSLQHKFQEADRQVLSGKRDDSEAQLTEELGQLKTQFAAKQDEIAALKSQLQDAAAVHGELATLRAELEKARASEQAAKAEAAKQRAATEATRTHEPDNKELLNEIDRLQTLLKTAQEAETTATAEAAKLREIAGKAASEALKQRRAAKQARAQASRNQRLASQATELSNRVRELEEALEVDKAFKRKVREVLGKSGRSGAERQSDRIVSVGTEVAEAFKALELEPSATQEDFKTAYNIFAALYHPDRLQGWSETARQVAEAKLKAANQARHVLEEYFRLQKAARADRNCA